MPRNVRRFAWLWWASSAIAIIEIPLIPPPSSSELRLGITHLNEMVIAAGFVVRCGTLVQTRNFKLRQHPKIANARFLPPWSIALLLDKQ